MEIVLVLVIGFVLFVVFGLLGKVMDVVCAIFDFLAEGCFGGCLMRSISFFLVVFIIIIVLFAFL